MLVFGADRPHFGRMFMVSELEAAMIRRAFALGGEVSAARELRRLFKGLPDNAETMASARTIAGWKPLALPPRPKIRRARKGN